ncbi:hypothetical protein MVEN_02285900 [Mycena venus]|uniref:Transmembrane protein n=1 Tax=Mycena venus TaxID=2733690 RepID=A0A8H6X4X9_9AGAR|nr:hypothetical protein MVEN_02285900 [Mycena venus]
MNVLVDDNNPLVQYSNYSRGWRLPSGSGQPQEFNRTTHEPLSPDESATLAFNGTSITVFGTVANKGKARMNFSIDGRPSGSFEVDEGSAQGHNMRFWNASDLKDTLHNLSIIVDHDSLIRTSRTLFLDYFVYTTTSTAGKLVLIDDSDTALRYSKSGWHSQNDSDSSLERTQHFSDKGGSWVCLSFEGTQISLFGTGPTPSFATIDGSSSLVNLRSRDDPPSDKQFFQSSTLSPGNHTLNITVGPQTAIDYFLVTTESDPPSTSLSSSSIGLTDPAPTGASKLPAGAPQATGGLKTSKPLPIAAIVGGAVGGLALLLLVLVAVLMWRRRARRADQPAFEYPATSESYYPWANKRVSVTSLTTLTEENEGQRPKNFEKERPPSRYIYYE